MNKEQFFIGEPFEFKRGIKIYPPTVKDMIANPFSTQYGRLLTYSQEEIEDEFLEAKKPLEAYPTPLEFLLSNSYHNEEYRRRAKEAFQFFLHDDVNFFYEQKLIVVGDLNKILQEIESFDDLVVIKEEEFFDFQNVIRESIGKKTVEPPITDEDPRIAEMKRKARRRDRLKAKQAAKSKGGVSLYAMIVSICCMGIGITPLNIGEMSYVALEDVVRKYQEKEKYDLDIQSLLAGADSKKVKPKYWIKNFED